MAGRGECARVGVRMDRIFSTTDISETPLFGEINRSHFGSVRRNAIPAFLASSDRTLGGCILSDRVRRPGANPQDTEELPSERRARRAAWFVYGMIPSRGSRTRRRSRSRFLYPSAPSDELWTIAFVMSMSERLSNHLLRYPHLAHSAPGVVCPRQSSAASVLATSDNARIVHTPARQSR